MVNMVSEKEIKSLLLQKERVIVAIDGPCASGKTTFAKKLAQCFDSFVFHTDDFFLRPEQRTADRLGEPGGNLDRERFLEEVLLPLRSEKKVSFSPYLCSEGALGDKIAVPEKRLYIIEGSYSHHPFFGEYDGTRVGRKIV
jgi:uridine kinase